MIKEFEGPIVDLFILHQDGATPLHYAVQVGAMQTVKLLIKYNVDVNIADNVSETFYNHLCLTGVLFSWSILITI